jgi:hypothetical protein
MIATVLTPEDHGRFLGDGYLLLHGAVSPDVVDRALQLLEGRPSSGVPGTVEHGRQAPKGPELDACLSPTIIQAIGELFGDTYPFDRNGSPTDMPRPHTPDATEWPIGPPHLDDDYPQLVPGEWALGLFVFLTQVRSRGGAFLLVPGSPATVQSVLAEQPECHLVEATIPGLAERAEEMLAEPGDALLFHHLMVHSGTNNLSDPRTRHALLARFHPRRRVESVDKPVERMTTIERANAARATDRGRAAIGDGAIATLRDGIAPGPAVRAQAPLRWSGVNHVFLADAERPTVVRRGSSDDFAGWTWSDALELPAEVVSLAVRVERGEVLLLASTDGDTHIFASTDLEHWTAAGTLPGAHAVAPSSTSEFGSATARGKLVLHVGAGDPGVIGARWGSEWRGAGDWAGQAVAATTPEGRGARDVTMHSLRSEQAFGLVAELDDGELVAARSSDCATFGALSPLRCDGPATPSALRIYARARDYWLVSGIRDGRVVWAAVDWQDEPVLQPLEDVAALGRALEMVGLR